MADPTYSIGPQPKWYLVDNLGRPTAGFMYTYSNLNPTEYKPVYSEQNDGAPYPQPVPFDANGTAGPIYFKFDSDEPDDLYYLRFYDADNNFLYDINNYEASGGGGGSVTTAFNLKNYTGNNVFLYNYYTDPTTTASPIPNNTLLSPSNHNGFIDPDVRFFTDGSGGTDFIRFDKFILGANPLTTDVTPQYCLHYESTVAASGETKKYIQIPIEPKVNTLDDQVVTCSFWARTTGGSSDEISIVIKQFYGTPITGSPPSASTFTTLGGGAITLDGSWTRYAVTGTIPTVGGKTVSDTGDDAVYLLIQIPNNTTITFDIAVPRLFLGNSAPASDFTSQQQIEALIQNPRTGDVKNGMQYDTYIPGGWMRMGNVNIGDSQSGSSRANLDTWLLFNMIWNTTSNTDCPIYTNTGVPSTRTTAPDDWGAHKRLSLPLNVGSVVANNGGGHAVGSFAGTDTHTLTIAEMPAHAHPGSVIHGLNGGATAPPWHSVISSSTGSGGTFTDGVTVASQGDGAAHSIVQPTTYIPSIMKL